MQLLSRIVILACVFFTLVIGFFLVVTNPQVVTLSLVSIEYTLNLGLILTVFFSAGLLLGLGALLLVVTSAKLKLSLKDKELLKLKEKLN